MWTEVLRICPRIDFILIKLLDKEFQDSVSRLGGSGYRPATNKEQFGQFSSVHLLPVYLLAVDPRF